MDIIEMRDWRNKPAHVTEVLRTRGKDIEGSDGTIGIRYRGKIIGWIVPGDDIGPITNFDPTRYISDAAADINQLAHVLPDVPDEDMSRAFLAGRLEGIKEAENYLLQESDRLLEHFYGPRQTRLTGSRHVTSGKDTREDD